MLLRTLPLLTGLLPILAIHASLVIAISAGTIPACFPYIDGCTSISATGRYEPASFVFKPAMIAESIIMVCFWLCSAAWLQALERSAYPPEQQRRVLAIAWTGCVGALFLIVYVTFLGTQGPVYAFMRRFGVYLYFALTILAQIEMVLRLRPLTRLPAYQSLRKVVDWQVVIVVIPFVLGILNLVLKAVLEDPDNIENVIEWIFALLMHVYFVLTWILWRRTGFRASVAVD